MFILPDFNQQFQVEADACNIGLGGVSSQLLKNFFRPVSYFNKRLSKPQHKYLTSERELLAIVFAVEHFDFYMRFKVITDHQPLRTLLTSDNMSARLARWLSRLQLFEFEIEYRPGKNQGNADG